MLSPSPNEQQFHALMGSHAPEEHEWVITEHRHGANIVTCSVSADGKQVAFADNDKRVYLARKSEKDNQVQVEPLNSGQVVDVSIAADSVAIAGDDGSAYVWRLSNPRQLRMTKRLPQWSMYDKVRFVRLCRDATKLVSVLSRPGRNDQVFVTQVATSLDMHVHSSGLNVHGLAIDADAKKVFILKRRIDARDAYGRVNPQKYAVEVWDVAANAFNIAPIDVVGAPNNTDAYNPAICADAGGNRVIIADFTALHIWYLLDNQIVALPNYFPVRGDNTAAVTPSGHRLVAVTAGNNFGVWDCNRKIKLMAIYAGYYPATLPVVASCAISDDGTVVVLGCPDKQVRVACSRVASSEKYGPSQLEVAFAAVLADPDLFDMDYLLQHIRSEYVLSATDLLLGHNLVLFAIRTGVLTKENIDTLGGSRWFLQDNLYLPASKLSTENAALLDAVFYHAEKVGIISNGYALKIAREIRVDVGKAFGEMGHVIKSLSSRLHAVERRMEMLQLRSDTLFSTVQSLRIEQSDMQSAVRCLGTSLTNLQKSLRVRHKRMKYASVARCMLSLVPMVGKALGEVAYTATDIFFSLSAEDLMEVGVDSSKWAASQIAEVDLTNFHVAHCAMSKMIHSKLDHQTQGVIFQSIQTSSIESPAQLKSIFTDEISRLASDEKSTIFLDMGTSAWLTSPNGSCPPNGSSPPKGSSPSKGSCPSKASSPLHGSSPSNRISPSNVSRLSDDFSLESAKVEKMARGKFQVATLGRGIGQDMLTLEEGRNELNCLLADSAGFEPVSEDDFVDLFFSLADDDAEKISEDVFSKMFQEIYEKQKKRREHVERFRSRAKPRNCLHLRLAARLISNFRKEDLARRSLPYDSSDIEVVSQELHAFDADQNGNFSEDEFMVAVKKLVYDFKIK